MSRRKLFLIGFICFLLCNVIILSCTDQHDIGRLPGEGLNNIYVKLDQDNEFDHSTGIHYEIIFGNGQVIVEKTLLTGCSDYIEDLSDFTAGSCDSVIFVTFFDSTHVFAVYDLKTGNGHPRSSKETDYKTSYFFGDSLIQELNSCKPELKADWKH